MTFEKLKQIFSDEFELDEEIVTLDAILLEDLGLDSIDLADLVMSVEDEFFMELPDEALENIKSVGDLVKYIEENK
jgi:acyl carrier protein